MSDYLVAMFPLDDVLGIFSEAYEDQDPADEIVKIRLEGVRRISTRRFATRSSTAWETLTSTCWPKAR